MGKRINNKTRVQLDVTEETKNEIKDIQAIFQKNDPYGYVSISKVFMILVKEKWNYYNSNNYFETIQEEKVKPIKSHKQTRLKLDNKSKNNDLFDNNEVKDITIASINESNDVDMEELKKEIEEWRQNLRDKRKV